MRQARVPAPRVLLAAKEGWMLWAEGLTMLLVVYGLAGVVFAALFLWKGVDILDGGARGTGLGFRMLIAPGCVALWPLLAMRWVRR